MIAIAERIAASAADLADADRSDPNAAARLASDLRRAVRLCRLCLSYCDSPRDLPAWEEVVDPKRGPQQFRPWTRYNAAQWLSVRERLLAVLVKHYDALSVDQDVAESRYDASTRRTRFRLSEALYALLAHCVACAYARADEATRRQLGGLPADADNECVRFFHTIFMRASVCAAATSYASAFSRCASSSGSGGGSSNAARRCLDAVRSRLIESNRTRLPRRR